MEKRQTNATSVTMHLLRQAIWGDISKHTAGKTGCENTSFQCFLCGYTWSNIIRINWNPEKRMSNTISTLRFLIIQETKNFQKKELDEFITLLLKLISTFIALLLSDLLCLWFYVVSCSIILFRQHIYVWLFTNKAFPKKMGRSPIWHLHRH